MYDFGVVALLASRRIADKNRDPKAINTLSGRTRNTDVDISGRHLLSLQENQSVRMSRHARRYTLFRRVTESIDCKPDRLARHTRPIRPRYEQVGSRAFVLAEAQEYYAKDLLRPEYCLRVLPRIS